ncbi:hypothetical protein OIU84_011931 [Salix udensis]|uniref:Uncharacterized protein n=1 Tax=Salix udensis TaxID=889485 RepID=A0AAD6NSN7_9ROSI|nr:hypothetical protein OIU84_011931 [Salix udensis]
MAASQKLFAALFHVLLLSLFPLKTKSSARTQAEALVQWRDTLSSSPPPLPSWSRSNLHNICSIPVEISRLTELQYLSLYNNSLSGAIPFQLASLPKAKYQNCSIPIWESLRP